jgi:hypothetical protein
MPYEAVRIMLAEKFGQLPSDIDRLPFPEALEILYVLDGQGKASSTNIG